MTVRSSIVFCVVGSLATVAVAAPTTKKPPPIKIDDGKQTKKQLEIEKHEWMAQFYVTKKLDYAAAAKEYLEILKLEPDNTSATLALASIYSKDVKDKQGSKKGIDLLVKLTKKNPKSEEAWLQLAELYTAANDEKNWKAAIDQVEKLDPSNADVQWQVFNRARKKIADGDISAKQDALEAARKIKLYDRHKGTDEYKQVERAIVELSGDPMDLTIYDAKNAYSTAFDSPSMGRINTQMGAARRGFEECTKTQPKNEECHYYLGLVYGSIKASDSYDSKKALAEYALAPTLPLAYVETARIHRQTDNNAAARAALEKALQLDGDLSVANIELGIVDKLDGKTDAAIKHFVAAIDSDPYGPNGDKALIELAKVAPTHPKVQMGVMRGKGNDVFSSERYKSVIPLIEQQLGGVDKGAPEQQIVEDIVHRIADANGLKQEFKVSFVSTSMVNAFALADGHVYVTRGLIDLMKKKFPNRPVDANNDALAAILGHELTHVIHHHTLNSTVFQEAMKDASRPLDPAVVTHVTRLNEIDADREGMIMAFVAGYHPRGGIEFMEIMGQQMEIPKHLDHPTFEERVQFLSDFWTNDVRYAFVSFKLGVSALDRGGKLEATDMQQAIAAYEEAVDDFKRFRTIMANVKEGMNDLGIAYSKLGVLAMNKTDTPLGRWQTRFSLERESVVKYIGLVREEKTSARGTTEKVRLPWQLREGINQFKEALAADDGYTKARLNLATAYLAAAQLDNAKDALGKIQPGHGITQGDIELVRGVIYGEGRDFDKAKAAFEKAVQSQSAKRAASYNLAKTLELAGKKDEAKRAYAQYIKLYPGGPWAKAAEAASAKL